MMTGTIDQLVDDYMTRLNQAAAGMPAQRRIELLEEITDHITAARAAGAAADEAAVRTLLDRLGEPEEIVASARDDLPSDGPGWIPPSTPPPTPNTRLENAAVALITLGSLIPVIGWVVGIVLVWMSERWRTWEKLLATLVFPLGSFGWLYLSQILMNSSSRNGCISTPQSIAAGDPGDCYSEQTSTPFIGPIALLILFIAPLIVAGYLYYIARARARNGTQLETS